MPIERAVYNSSAWTVFWTAPGATITPPVLPVATFTATISGTTVSFDASASSEAGGTIQSYVWDFGDGAKTVASSAATTSHTYVKAGSFAVKLTVIAVDGSQASVTRSINIVAVNTPPISVFTVTVSGLAVGVNGTASSDPDGAIASYAWNFGDGGTATGVTASHTYSTSGTYTVSLTVTDNLGVTNTSTKSVATTGLPTAAFTAAIVASAPASGSFTYADVAHFQGTINWGSYALPGVMIKLGGSNSGTYTDSAYVTNVAGARANGVHVGHYWFNGTGDPATDAKYFVGALSQYKAEDFLILDVEAESGTTGTPWSPAKVLTFFQTIKGLKPTARLMVYMSNSNTTAYDWSSVVNYGVKLWDASWGANNGSRGTAPSPGGWSSYSLWQYTSVGTTAGITGNVDLSYTTTDLFPPYRTVNVNGSTTTGPNPINTYAWAWGDGSTTAASTSKTASHTYATAGTYQVTLTVKDSLGQTDTQTNAITIAATGVTDQPPVASFQTTVTNLALHVDGSASTDVDGTISSYAWNFGDGGTATGVTANHTYASAGTYTVKLTVTDNLGSTSSLSRSVVATAATNQPPVASFTASATNLAVSVNGSGSSDPDGSIASYAWNFGDGATASGVTASHTYASAGTYTITLTVTDNSGATDPFSRSVSVTAAPPVNQPPIASFTATATNLAVAFNASGSSDPDGTIVSYAWTYGDGSTGSGVTSNHTYAAAGTYGAVLVVTDNSGASSTSTRSVTVAAAGGIPTWDHIIYVWMENHSQTQIIGSSAAPYINGLANANIKFTNAQAIGHPSQPNYIAAFSGSTQGITDDNNHDLGAVANIFTQLQTKGLTMKGYVEAPGVRKHNPWESFSNTAGCEVAFTSFPTTNYATLPKLCWVVPNLTDDMHDGTIAQGDTWLKTNIDPVVTWAKANNSLVIITWDEDDSSTTNGNDIPLIMAGAHTVAGSYSTAVDHYSVLGLIQDSTGVPRLLNSIGKPALSGPFTTGTVNQPPVASFKATVTSLTVALNASTSTDADGTIASYAWDFGDGATGTGVTTSHTYSTAGTYTVRLTVTDNSGSTSSVSQSVVAPPVVANQPPIASFLAAVTNLAISVNGSASTDADGSIVSYAWTYGDGATGTGITAAHTYAAAGTYSVKLTVTDNAGATGTSTKSVTVTSVPVGGGNAAKSPWMTGSPTEGFPSNINVVKASTLATGGVLDLAQMVAKLTTPSVIDISNEQVVIGTFNGGNLSAVNGGSNFLGLLGGISNGVFDNQVTVQPNIFPGSVISAIQGNQSGTSQYAMIRTAAAIGGTHPVYFMGVHIVGADQGHVSDGGSAQITNGPARYKGIDMDLAQPGLFQNCLLEAMNYSDGSTPPWEVGAVDSRRSHGFTVRRVELSGQIPVGSPSRPNSSTVDPFGLGWLRSGGFQWNADYGTVMQNFSIHDGLVSGLTYSIAGATNSQPGPTGNNSGNITLNNLYVENQSQHGFSGINLEDCMGYIHIDHPTIKMNGSGGNHIGMNARLGGTVPVIPSANFVITEPTWSGGPAGTLFSVRIAGSAQWGNPPTVIKNGIQLTPTSATTGDPTKVYHVSNVA